MGGMGFIERFRIQCLRSILINTHMIEAAYRAGVERYFFSSSACAYNTNLQKDPNVRALQGVRRLPGHGRTGLRLGKAHVGDVLPGVLGRARHEDLHRPVPQRLRSQRHLGRRPREGARPPSAARSSRPKTPARDSIDIWGDGTQTRSFMYIDDCTQGIDRITHCDDLIATPINLGSSELVSINELVSLAEEIGGVKLRRNYQLDAPKGVAGRNSDNTMIQQILDWEPEHARSATDWPRPTPGSSSSTRTARPANARSATRSEPTTCLHRLGTPLPTASARSPTAWPWPADGSISPLSPGSIRRRRARWSWWRSSPPSASWTAPEWPRARATWPIDLWERPTARPARRGIGARTLRRREPRQDRALRLPGHDRPDLPRREPPGLRLTPTKGACFPGTSNRTAIPRSPRWLEQVIHVVPVAPRPPGYNPLGVKRLEISRSPASARPARTATPQSSARTRPRSAPR